MYHEYSAYSQSWSIFRQCAQDGLSSVHLRLRCLQFRQPVFERCLGPTTAYSHVHKPLLHWLQAGVASLHLIFFSRHLIQALFLASRGGGEGAEGKACFRDLTGDEAAEGLVL